MQLPVSLRKLNHNRIRRFMEKTAPGLILPGVFALGILVSAGEFLCTGQIYLATILYMIRRNPSLDLQTLLAFFAYVAGMMLPPMLLTLAVWRGKKVFQLSEFARRNMPLIKLINAAVFLVFGAILALVV
jgi:cytochrome c biogenesis protein CcdA